MLTTQHSSSQWLLLFVLLSLVLFGYKKRLLFSSFSNNSPLSISPLTMLTVLCRRKLFMGKKKKNLTGPSPYQDIVKFPRRRIVRRPL